MKSEFKNTQDEDTLKHIGEMYSLVSVFESILGPDAENVRLCIVYDDNSEAAGNSSQPAAGA